MVQRKEESAGAKVKDDKLSGSLTVYTAIEEELVPIYLDSFKKKYPDVKLNIVRDSTGVITAKLLAEGKIHKQMLYGELQLQVY